MPARILMLALALSLLALPAMPAQASVPENANDFDAIIVVGQSDLASLLESGYIGDYSLISAAELGLEEAALTDGVRFGENSILTPAELGLDTPEQRIGAFGGFSPFFRGFVAVRGRPHVPFFFFRPPFIRPPIPPFPIFPRVVVVPVVRPLLVPPPLPLPVALPPPPLPPPPLPPPPPSGRPQLGQPAAVPVIPEADSLALVGIGVAGIAALAWLRRRREQSH
jgi:hypothetical protein